MSSSSGLLLPASIVSVAIIIGASIAYHASQNRYEIAAASVATGDAGYIDGYTTIYRLDKASGVVTICQKVRDEDRKIINRLMDCSGISPKHP